MATYYWVGGDGTWDASTTTNWSLSSGGSGSAGVPSSTDNVVFDSNCGGGTTTFSTSGAVCKNFSYLSAGQLLGASSSTPQALSVYGDFLVPSPATFALSRNANFVITFAATTSGNTINAPDTNFNAVFNGVGGSWILANNFGVAPFLDLYNITFTNGSLNTAGYTLNFFSWTYSATGTFSLTLGVSICYVIIWNFSNATGLTFSGIYSTIKMKTGSSSFYGGGLTYGTLQIDNSGFGGGVPIYGSNNTFSRIYYVHKGPYNATIYFETNATTNIKDWAISGSSYNRVNIRSTLNNGQQATLNYTGTGTVSADYLGIKDINGTPSNTWSVGYNSVNSGNNTGLVFGNIFSDTVVEPTITVSDVNTAGSLFPTTTNETLGVNDVNLGPATFLSSIQEQIKLTDSSTVLANFLSSISEVVVFNEISLVIQAKFIFFITESLSVADIKTNVSAFTALVSEKLNTADTQSRILTQYATIVEGASLNELSKGLPWAIINDSETTVWAVINNSQ
jgi:hypothetical protein